MTGLFELLTDEHGAVTVEFTVLVPFFVFLLILFADASIVYLTHSEMYNAARDIARRMATEEIRTRQEVQAYAAAQTFLGQRTYTVSTEFGGEMRVTFAVPIAEAAFFGTFFTPVLGKALTATARMRREPFM